MRRILVISCACGLLAINVLALLLLVGPLSADSSDAAVVAAVRPVASPVSELEATPTDELPPGVQDMDAALASVGATPEAGSWPTWCGTPPESPWKMFGVTADGTRVGILIASAGDGTRLWRQQLLALTGCTQFRLVDSTPSSLTLQRTDVPVTWVVARRGDVLVSVLQVSEGASRDSLKLIAGDVVDRTTAQCVIGTDENADENMTRNPWRPGYQQWHPAVPIDTPEPGGPSVPEVSVLFDWAAPEPLPRPELAVIAKPDVTFNPYTTDILVAPVARVPVLIDPAELVPPAVPRPDAPPPAAIAMPTTATAYFARADTLGPGCGWAFAGTVPPEFDPQLPARELEGRIDGAFTTAAAHLASWLEWSVDARANAQKDAETRAALAVWATYDQALQKASLTWQSAVLRRLTSLDTWFAYVPVDPLPALTEVPSAVPTDVPSVDPNASTTPSAAPTGVR